MSGLIGNGKSQLSLVCCAVASFSPVTKSSMCRRIDYCLSDRTARACHGTPGVGSVQECVFYSSLVTVVVGVSTWPCGISPRFHVSIMFTKLVNLCGEIESNVRVYETGSFRRQYVAILHDSFLVLSVAEAAALSEVLSCSSSAIATWRNVIPCKLHATKSQVCNSKFTDPRSKFVY